MHNEPWGGLDLKFDQIQLICTLKKQEKRINIDRSQHNISSIEKAEKINEDGYSNDHNIQKFDDFKFKEIVRRGSIGKC